MTSAGTRTSSSMVRMGTLIKITVNNNDDESRGKIMSWLDDVITGIRKDIAAVAAMIEENVKMAELDGIDLPELITVEPEKKWYTYANHPALLKLLQELSKVDAQALMVDRLWYAGLVDDKQKAISSKQLVHPFYSVVDLITKVTDIGGRKGGRYNPMDFIEALRKEESIAAMIDKYIRAKSVEANKAKSEGLDAGYHAETPEIAAE